MIGSGLKKLAKEHNMSIDSGVAYGSFYGYAATFYEGGGWKEIAVSCLFPDPEKNAQLQSMLDSHDLRKEYRVLELVMAPNGMRIRFHDNPGTMKRIIAFAQWFFPQLQSYGVTSADICPQCGMSIASNGTWQLVGDMAIHMHPGCADRLQNTENRKAQLMEEEAANTSYMSGTVGALIGGLIGAMVWAVVLYMGYVLSLIGILIGYLASKGYDLTHGKQKKGKIAILLFVTVLCVVLANFAVDAVVLAQMISAGELPGYAFGDIGWMILYMLMEDSEYLTGTLSNIGLGLLYALLGLSVVLLRVHKETKGFKMKQLK